MINKLEYVDARANKLQKWWTSTSHYFHQFKLFLPFEYTCTINLWNLMALVSIILYLLIIFWIYWIYWILLFWLFQSQHIDRASIEETDSIIDDNDIEKLNKTRSKNVQSPLFAYYNINSLRYRFDDLKEIWSNTLPDVLVFAETNL